MHAQSATVAQALLPVLLGYSSLRTLGSDLSALCVEIFFSFLLFNSPDPPYPTSDSGSLYDPTPATPPRSPTPCESHRRYLPHPLSSPENAGAETTPLPDTPPSPTPGMNTSTANPAPS